MLVLGSSDNTDNSVSVKASLNIIQSSPTCLFSSLVTSLQPLLHSTCDDCDPAPGENLSHTTAITAITARVATFTYQHFTITIILKVVIILFLKTILPTILGNAKLIIFSWFH